MCSLKNFYKSLSFNLTHFWPFINPFLAPSNILSLVLSIRKLIQFKLNKSKHYVSQNLCRNRGINFLLADKNLSENGQTYQFVS